MKSQYPEQPITYQNSEPLNYLQTYCRIQQISPEKARIIKLQFKQADHQKGEDEPATFEKEEDDGLASFFYSQSFLEDEDI